LRETDATRPSSIVYDETPIQTYMERIYARLRETGEVNFSSLFEADMHKSVLIGIFLAILELVRHYKVRVRQDQLFGEIDLIVDPDAAETLELVQVDTYDDDGDGGEETEGGSEGEMERETNV
jgi:segregation and condensation protein A